MCLQHLENTLERADQIAEQVVRPTGLIDPEIEIRPIATLFRMILKKQK